MAPLTTFLQYTIMIILVILVVVFMVIIFSSPKRPPFVIFNNNQVIQLFDTQNQSFLGVCESGDVFYITNGWNHDDPATWFTVHSTSNDTTNNYYFTSNLNSGFLDFSNPLQLTVDNTITTPGPANIAQIQFAATGKTDETQIYGINIYTNSGFASSGGASSPCNGGTIVSLNTTNDAVLYNYFSQ